MEVTKIDFTDDNVAKGNVVLFKNVLGKSKGKYFARFERRTVNDDIIVARIHERGVGLDDLTVKAVIGLYKKEVVAALGRGESINLMDLGTLYIRATGAVNSREAAPSLMNLEPAFTPSKVAADAVASVKINGASLSEPGPRMEEVMDLFTGTSSLSLAKDEENPDAEPETMGLTEGKVAVIRGSRLKIAGDEGGVFFCPLGEDGKPVADRSRYVAVSPDKLSRNRAQEVEFFIPKGLNMDTQYRILVRTNYMSPGKSLKSYREVLSDPLVIRGE
ncbi:MAG: DUF4469 domain-containing protein [Treponema sp.]|nr:DUF4469 domain-containing protein [Treponema sp.]